MSEQIKNPYVATYSKYSPNAGWSVLYRYLIGNKIRFSFVANTRDNLTAKKLARLLNKDWRARNGVQDEEEKANEN